MTDTAPLKLDRRYRGADTEKQAIKVLVLYDERSSAVRAKTMLERIKGGCSEELELEYDFWRFDVLELTEVENLARWAFEAADLVVIATSRSSRVLSGGASFSRSGLHLNKLQEFGL